MVIIKGKSVVPFRSAAIFLFGSALLLCLFSVSGALTLTDKEIASYQKQISHKTIGERTAFWAEKFLDTPYDPDPLGEYVRKNVIVADERVDCMYHVFRSFELAKGRTPDESIRVALDQRFITQGVLDNGVVINYQDRFQYGEDMIDSGKWGREITSEIGQVTFITGSLGRERVGILGKKQVAELLGKKKDMGLRDGDFIFFIKEPEKRVVGEIVGHIGIAKKGRAGLYVIHAGGKKNGSGKVVKVPLSDYVKTMPFAGIRVSRIEQVR